MIFEELLKHLENQKGRTMIEEVCTRNQADSLRKTIQDIQDSLDRHQLEAKIALSGYGSGSRKHKLTAEERLLMKYLKGGDK